jgi:5'-3' exonuclease
LGDYRLRLVPLVYRCGFSIEKINKETEILEVEPVHHAYYNINSMMKKILKHTKNNQYNGWLTSNDKSNFRFDIYDQYKSNRKDARKPIYYHEIREFLVTKWKANITSGQEADDQCSIDHCEFNKLGFDPENLNSIVCSFDKDFNNIPGWHYNFVKDDVYYIDELQAARNFYLQILTGDTSDGIPRIQFGWKKKKTVELLEKALTIEEMEDIIYKELERINTELYKKEKIDQFENFKDLNEVCNYQFTTRGQLVWLRREVNEFWTPLRLQNKQLTK